LNGSGVKGRRRRTGDEGHDDKRRDRKEEAQPEAVDIGQHIGLSLF
jgi:hypothetical protein